MMKQTCRIRSSRSLRLDDWRQRLAFGDELHRDRVHTVASILVGESFAKEHVSQMTTTVLAGDLSPVTIFIHVPVNRAFDFVVETWPAAVTAELVFCQVQWRVAVTTDVRSGIFEVRILTDKRSLSSLIKNHVRLQLRERIVFRRSIL